MKEPRPCAKPTVSQSQIPRKGINGVQLGAGDNIGFRHRTEQCKVLEKNFPYMYRMVGEFKDF